VSHDAIFLIVFQRYAHKMISLDSFIIGAEMDVFLFKIYFIVVLLIFRGKGILVSKHLDDV